MKKIIFTLVYIGLACRVCAQDMPLMNGYIDYKQRGDAYAEKMAYAKALEIYELGLSKRPEDKGLILAAARTNRLLGDTEAAERYFSQVVTNDSDPKDLLAYAEVLASNEKYDAAENWMATYESRIGKDELAERRKEGFNQVNVFYKDSAAYEVHTVSFNSPVLDFAPVYFEGGIAFLSNRGSGKLFTLKDARAGGSFLDLFLVNEGVEAQPIEPLNDVLNEGPLTFLDDHTLITTVNFSGSQKNSTSDKVTKLKMLIYERTNEGWKQKGTFPLNDPNYSVGHPAYDPNGGYLYFASDMPGGSGEVDLYRISYSNGQWGTAENLKAINTAGKEVFPFFDTRNNELYFSSDGYAGLGGLDIYKTSAAMEQVVNVGYPVNSSMDDFTLVLDKTGLNGYFSSNREGGQGQDDIYALTIKPVQMSVQLLDSVSQKSIAGSISVWGADDDQKLPVTLSDGVFSFAGIPSEIYRISAVKEGYESKEIEVTAGQERSEVIRIFLMPEESEKGVMDRELLVIEGPVETHWYAIGPDEIEEVEAGTVSGTPVSVESIYFDLNDSGTETLNSLDPMVEMLKKYGYLQLMVKASTDSRGTRSYNRKLAEKRVETIVRYFVNAGIDASRIRSEALGEKGIVNECTDEVECPDAKHAQNRRVDFFLSSQKLVKM